MVIEIKVLGPGCKNCDRVELHTQQAVGQWQADHPEVKVVIDKVTDPEAFLDYGLLTTPGLVISGKLVSSGKIPAPSHIVGWLNEAIVTPT